MRLRHKDWAQPLVDANKDKAYNMEDISKEEIFEIDQLEIGSGLGGFIIKKAYLNPDVKFLGVEVCFSAYATSLKKMITFENENNCKLDNLHFFNAPIEKLFEKIKPESLDVIYLNFNDPWPKKRHNKRRLTFPTHLEEYYKLLKKGGKVLYKSDNDLYYEDSKKYFDEFKKFKTTFIDDYVEIEKDDVESEYEHKFRSKGNKIHRIIAIKE